MNDLHKLIRQIRDHLAGSAPGAAVETLAADYARACADATARLDTCAAMLEKGSDYQALQLAETAPPLLDMLATLSFAEAAKWTQLCATRGLPAAAPFDQRAVTALDALYRRGVSANHPLYRDYRAAVTARDDTRALGIIRSIARLNPGDANATGELARLENKAFQSLRQRLHTGIESGDDAAVLATLEELERIPAARELPGNAEYDRAVAMRRNARARDAANEASLAVMDLPSFRANGDWRGAAAVMGRIEALTGEHGFALSDESARTFSEVRAWANAGRAAAEETVRFHEAVSRLGVLSADAGARLRARQPLTAQASAGMLLTLERAWKEVEAFGRPVDDETINTARAAAAAVRAESHRLHRARVVKFAVITVVAIVIAGAGGWWLWQVQSGGDFRRQLAQFEAAGDVEPAEQLVENLRRDKPGLASRPQLHAQIEKTAAWTRDARRRQADATASLEAVEKHAAAHFSSTEAGALSGQFDATGTLLSSLPASLRPAMQSRLDAARTAFEKWLAGQRETIAQAAAAELARLEGAAQEKLRLDLSSDALAATLGELDPALRSFDALVNPTLKSLAIPAALATRFAGVRERANLIRAELEVLARCREKLMKAATLDEFRAALDGFKDSQLTASPEVQAAGKLAAQFPTADALLAALLMPDDPVSWQAMKQEAADPWKPKDVLEAELNGFFALRDDPMLNSIFEATVLNSAGASRKIYSKTAIQPPSEQNDSSPDGSIRILTWSGRFMDRKSGLPGLNFLDTTYVMRSRGGGRSGEELKDAAESAVTKAFRDLQLEKMTDADGKSYEVALLRQFERIAALTKTPPAFRAYLLFKLGFIADYRPNAWGLNYCRSLRADLAELRNLTADAPPRSADWLTPSVRDKAITALMDRFSTRKYFAEARAVRSVIADAKKAGLKLGGFMDVTGETKLQGEAKAGFALWTLDSDGKLTALGKGKAHPLAPVFFVPIQPAEILASVTRAYGGEVPPEITAKIPLVAVRP
jgi:hypothetical protein